MKRLISLLGAGLLFFGVNSIAQEISSKPLTQKEALSKLELPEKFVNYKESPSRRNLVNIGGGLFGMQEYDLDNDKKAEVQEIYRITSLDEDGMYRGPEQPLVYGFDINGDHDFTLGEIFRDGKEDGLNGNEIKQELSSSATIL